MFKVMKKRTLKRLTRLGLCMYLTTYCLTCTLSAQEYPVAGEDYIVDETVYASEAADPLDEAVMEAALPSDVITEEISGAQEDAETVTEDAQAQDEALTEDISGDEEGVEGAAEDPGYQGMEMKPFPITGYDATVTDFFNYVYDLDQQNDKRGFDFGFRLTQDLTVGDMTVPEDSKLNSTRTAVILDGNGYSIKGSSGKNLECLSYFADLQINNTRFSDFTDSALVIGERPDDPYYYNDLDIVRHHVTLTNCTFENNKGTNGGAIRADSILYLEMENCFFINNTATENGGAMAFLYNDSDVHAEDCEFKDNHAGNFGGVAYDVGIDRSDYYTGGYYFCDNVIINNSANKGAIFYRDPDFQSEAPSYSTIQSNIILNNTGNPIIRVYKGTDQWENDVSSLSGNYFGGSVDKPGTFPVIEGPSLWYRRLMDIRRIATDDGRLGFLVDLRFREYNNGTIEKYPGYRDDSFLNMTCGCSAEGLELLNTSFDMNDDALSKGYGGVFYADGASLHKNYNIKVMDPLGNVVLDRDYTSGNLTGYLDAFGNETTYPKYTYNGQAMEGDTFTFRVYGEVWDWNYETNSSVAYGDAHIVMVDQPVNVSINGGEPFVKITNATGYFNVTAAECNATGFVNFTITSDKFDGSVSTEQYVWRNGEVSGYVYGPGNITYGGAEGEWSAVEVDMSSPFGTVDDGICSVYVVGSDGKKNVLKSWDLSKYGYNETKPYFYEEVPLDASLDAGVYRVGMEYNCTSGKFLPKAYESKWPVQINPRNATITWNDDITFIFDGELHAPTANASGLLGGDNAYVLVDGAQMNVGKYIAEAKGFGGDKGNNYQVIGNNLQKEFEILKAEGMVINTTDYAHLSEGQAVYETDLSKLMPENAGNMTFSAGTPKIITGAGTVGSYKVKGDSLTAVMMGVANGDQVLLPVKVESSNYNTTDINIMAVMTNKEITNVTIDGGDELVKGIEDGSWQFTAQVEKPGNDPTWKWSSANINVAAINATSGLASFKAKGSTLVSTVYESDSTIGTDNIMLTITDGGSGSNTSDNMTTTKVISPTENVTVEYTQSVTWSKDKPVVKEISTGQYQVGKVKVSVSSDLIDKLDFTFKVKNAKNVPAAGMTDKKKLPYIQVGAKSKKGVKLSKPEKVRLKTLKKELKSENARLYFNLLPVDFTTLSADKIKVTLDPKKTKVKKLYVNVDGKDVKLGKKDFTAQITSDSVTITGQGNFRGTVTISLSGK